MSSDQSQSVVNAKELERKLRSRMRGEVRFDAMTRGLHATDASHYQMMPACVVVPRDEQDCVQALKIASQFGVPVVPRGGATSLSGQTFGTGGIHQRNNFSYQPEALQGPKRAERTNAFRLVVIILIVAIERFQGNLLFIFVFKSGSGLIQIGMRLNGERF